MELNYISGSRFYNKVISNDGNSAFEGLCVCVCVCVPQKMTKIAMNNLFDTVH
jgi:hypothetical protein